MKVNEQKKNKQVTIKGKDYNVYLSNNYSILNDELVKGYCSFADKEIGLTILDDNGKIIQDEDTERVVLHELIHAYLMASGLPEWSNNELLVNWFANMIPEIVDSYCDILGKKKNER